VYEISDIQTEQRKETTETSARVGADGEKDRVCLRGAGGPSPAPGDAFLISHLHHAMADVIRKPNRLVAWADDERFAIEDNLLAAQRMQVDPKRMRARRRRLIRWVRRRTPWPDSKCG